MNKQLLMHSSLIIISMNLQYDVDCLYLLLHTLIVSFLFCGQNNILDTSSEGDKKEQALSISTDIPEVKVTDTSERKVISPAQMNIG